MKDLGPLYYFLGLKVLPHDLNIYLYQTKYSSDQISSTSLESNFRLNPSNESPFPDPKLYRQLVGYLVYLTFSRPVLVFSVHIVSPFMAAPQTSHFTGILNILRYIKDTMFHGLHFSSLSLKMLIGMVM